MLLFIVPRSLKYKYYNMYNILLEFYNYYLWVFSFMVLNYNLIFIFFKKFKGNTNTIFFKIFFFKHINVIIIFYKLTIDFLILLQKKFN